jgi:xanthine dehydrogenase accessory factor
VLGRKVNDPADTLRILQILSKGQVPVLVDPEAKAAQALHPSVIVDGRMRKQPPEPRKHTARLYIGLGVGFTAPKDCSAVIVTQRGHQLGRVIWEGQAQSEAGPSEAGSEEVLRAPAEGMLKVFVQIGEHVEAGQKLAEVAGREVRAPFAGVLRGLLADGTSVWQGQRIGDLDRRDDPALCALVSDRALAVGGGVLEAILSVPDLRPQIWK